MEALVGRTGNEAVVAQLAAEGIRYVFGNPGTVEQGFLDALEDNHDVEYVLAWQESVAVAMADGHARATGRPAFVQLHSGVGLGNAIGMLYQARRGNSPLVVMAGDAGVRYDAHEAQMAVDLVAMARPVTKHSIRVTDPRSVLRVLRRAFKIAATAPMGPVFVNLPADVLDQANDEPIFPSVVPQTRVVPVPELVAEAAELLSPGHAPLILIGDGVDAAGAQSALLQVAEQLGADVLGVNHSQANFPAAHPLFRGQTGHMFGTHSEKLVSAADAVLIVGTYVFPEVFPSLDDPFAPGAAIVHIDLDIDNIGKNHRVDLGLVADPAATLQALSAELTRTQTQAHGLAAAHRTGQRRSTAAAPPLPATVAELFFAELQSQAPQDLALFDEALTGSPTVTSFLPPRGPGHWFQTRGGSLGVGIPGALGIKLARPESEVIAVTGDGGSMYTIQALATAARYQIAAKAIIWNNHRYRLLDDNLAVFRSETGSKRAVAPTGFDLRQPGVDFVLLARSLGVPGVRVAAAADVADAVTAMLSATGPYLVELIVDLS
jgi:benzoylformate decarboxylase